MSEQAREAPKTEYGVFSTAAEFRAAVDRLLEQEGRELRVFDPDLVSLQLNDPARVERIERFQRASRTRRLLIVVHDQDPLVKRTPRMMALFSRYVHAIQIHRTHEEIRSIQDSFLARFGPLRAPASGGVLPRRCGHPRRDRGAVDALALPGNLVGVLSRGQRRCHRPLIYTH